MKYLTSEIAAACGGTLQGPDRVARRVVTDSRSFQVGTAGASGAASGGDSGAASGGASGGASGAASGAPGGAAEAIFVALRGANRDGADYVGELYARGVRAFMVGAGFGGFEAFPEAGFVLVDNTLRALQDWAALHRCTLRGRVVGITGSTGKTTVKEWIAQMAPEGVTVFRSPKSWNSQLGVALSVLAAGDQDYVVIEAGISQPGEMARLQHIIRPDVGILTSIGGAHEEGFSSLEELRAEKEGLFRGCSTVLRGEDLVPRGDEVAPRGADIAPRGEDIAPRGAADDDFARRCAGLAEAFWQAEGFEVEAGAVAALEPVAMRLEVKEGLHNSVIVNDIYNSDSASLAIALDYLARVAGDRPRIVITPQSVADRPENAAMIAAAGVEKHIAIGPQNTMDQALRDLTSAELQGRAILIKGGAREGFERLSSALERRSHTTVMEVDLDAMIANLALCRRLLRPGVGVMPMIKAAGYGHGTFEVARTLEQQGVDYLAVAFADEGVALRRAGITAPIVVLNADAGSFEVMIRWRLEPEIYNFVALSEFVALLKRHGEQLYPIHIKLDTGMHRLGFRGGNGNDTTLLIKELATAERYARVATIFSHLAAADDPAQDDFTREQIADFERVSSVIAAALPYPVRRHIAGTAAVGRFPEAQFDMVRLGLGLYGFGMAGARPIAELRTRIVHVARLPKGETVGYNRRGKLQKDSVIATIPIGYADGLNRRLSNGAWSVLINGRPAPIIGNICMDSCMVDISGNGHGGLSGVPSENEVKVGDEVTIFSATPGNTAADMAAALGTIPYEVLTAISARVKRIYTKE